MRFEPAKAAIVSSTTVSTTSDNLVPSPNPQNSTFDPSTIPGYFGSDIGTFSTSTAPNGFTFSTSKSDSMTMGLPTVGGSPVSNSLVYSNSSHTAYKLSGSYGTLNVFFKHLPYSTKISIQANLVSAQIICVLFSASNQIIQDSFTNSTTLEKRLLPSVTAGNEGFEWLDISVTYSPIWNSANNSLCVSLPIGQTNIDPLALDGSGSKGQCCSSPATSTASMTTSTSNDVLVCMLLGGNDQISTVTSSPSLTWSSRGTHAGIQQNQYLAEYYTTWSSSGTISITATWGAGSNADTISCFGVSGANTGSPFDPNLSTASFQGTNPCVVSCAFSFTTTNANDFVFGQAHDDATAAPFTCSVGTGYTQIQIITDSNVHSCGSGGGNWQAISEYKIVSSSGSQSVSFNFGASPGVDFIGDAIQQNAVVVTQPIKITTANGAPSATITISGCAVSNGTFTANGNVKHYSSITASCTITLTRPSDSTFSGYRFNKSPHPTISDSVTLSTCAGPGTCTEYDNTTWLIQEQVYNATAQAPNKWDGTYTGLTAKGEFLGMANQPARTCPPGSVTQGDTTDTVCSLAAQFYNGATFDYNTPVTLQNPIGGSWFSSDNVFTQTTAGNTNNAHYIQTVGLSSGKLLGVFLIASIIVCFIILAVRQRRR
jgi:hypothetical protein